MFSLYTEMFHRVRLWLVENIRCITLNVKEFINEMITSEQAENNIWSTWSEWKNMKNRQEMEIIEDHWYNECMFVSIDWRWNKPWMLEK